MRTKYIVMFRIYKKILSLATAFIIVILFCGCTPTLCCHQNLKEPIFTDPTKKLVHMQTQDLSKQLFPRNSSFRSEN